VRPTDCRLHGWLLVPLLVALAGVVAAQQQPKLRDFEAQGDMEIDLATNTVTLTGDVRLIVRKPREATLKAETAKVQLDETRKTVLQAEAIGNVEFRTTTTATADSPAREIQVTCLAAQYQPGDNAVALSGGPKGLVTSLGEDTTLQKLSLSGGRMLYSLPEETLTVTGAAHLEGLLAPTAQTGRQRVVGDAATAVLDQKARRIVLQGKAKMRFQPIPETTQGPAGEVEGDLIEYDLGQAKARVKRGPDAPARLQFDLPPPEGEAET
jgi:lipopolysaccharide export system protein LptA